MGGSTFNNPQVKRRKDGLAHMTTRKIMELREMYADPKIMVKDIAIYFGLKYSQDVSRIATGRAYPTVPGAVPARRNGSYSQFTPKQVRQIREKYDRLPHPKPTMVEFGELNGTTAYVISRILRGATFPDAGGPLMPNRQNSVERQACRYGHPMPENAVPSNPNDCRICKADRNRRYQSRQAVKDRKATQKRGYYSKSRKDANVSS